MMNARYMNTGYGLLLTSAEMTELAARALHINKDKMTWNTFAAFIDLYPAIRHFEMVDGGSVFLTSRRLNHQPDDTEEHSSLYVIDAEKQPTLFSPAYTGKDELIEEFRTRFEFLPEDFDYLSHIGEYAMADVNSVEWSDSDSITVQEEDEEKD